MQRLAAAASCVALASTVSAQNVWGVDGQWQLVAGTGPAPSGGSYWHHSATVAGCYFVVGGTASGANATYQYDPTTNAWTMYPPLPAGAIAPGLTGFGGLLVASGGQDFSFTNNMYYISTTKWSTGWQTLPVTNGPTPRSGHRIIAFGGIVYLFGGWDATQYYNDLYAVDLQSALMATPPSGAWVQLTPNGAPGMPAPRNSFTLDVMGHSIILFGGFSHNVQAGPNVQCTEPNAQCKWYSDVWIFRPGNTGSLTPSPTANGWTQYTGTQTQSGTFPVGRYGHASGVLSDQLYIFGGIGAGPTGPVQLADMWAFDMLTGTWGMVDQTSPWPSARGWPAGVMIGRHLYVFSGDQTSTASDLWRWAPVFVPNAQPQVTPASQSGVTAGFVINILIALGTLGLLVVMYRRGTIAQITPAAAGDVYGQLSA